MPDFKRRGGDGGGRGGRFGYREDDRYLLGAPPRWKAFASVGVGELPVSDLSHLVVNVIDQGAAPFCFANAVAQAIRMCEVRNGEQSPLLPSRLALVYFTHAIEGDVHAFDGAYISDTFQVVEQLGFASETAWPYDDSPSGNFNVRPSQDVVRLSFDQIALSYRRILSTGDQRLADVAAALAAGKPVVFGTNVTKAFAQNRLGPDYTYDVPKDEDIEGGHAMIFTGRRPDGRFRVLNGWSEEFGDAGYCNFTPEAVRWQSTRELWAVDFKRRRAA